MSVQDVLTEPWKPAIRRSLCKPCKQGKIKHEKLKREPLQRQQSSTIVPYGGNVTARDPAVHAYRGNAEQTTRGTNQLMTATLIVARICGLMRLTSIP